MIGEKEKKLQKLYAKFQLLEQHIKQAQQQSAVVNVQLAELVSISQSLEDLKNVKPNTEILVPISSGVYTKAEIKDTNNLLVNVGANTIVEKKLSDTKKIMEKQVEEMKKLEKQMIGELSNLSAQAALIENEMNKLVSN